jgi:hypothetical protein
VVSEPSLIVQVPDRSSVQRQLDERPPESLARGAAVIDVGPADEQGVLEPAAGGQIVLSVPSPESLAREAPAIRHVIDDAGIGSEPLLVVVEVAEELREEELGALVAAAEHARRPVILRVMRGT